MREHKAYSVLVIDDDSVAIAALERGLAEKLSLKIEGNIIRLKPASWVFFKSVRIYSF